MSNVFKARIKVQVAQNEDFREEDVNQKSSTKVGKVHTSYLIEDKSDYGYYRAIDKFLRTIDVSEDER